MSNLRFKKIGIILLALLMFSNIAYAKNFKAIMVTDVAGLGDKSFNDAAWTGMQKAKKDLGAEISCLQSYEQADYVSNLNLAAQNGDVVIAMGFLLSEAVQTVAKIHPKKHFIFIDGEIKAPNVASFNYKSEEGAYLAGILAGAVSKTNNVGIIEGMEIPPVKTFEAGFRAGVKTANVYFKKNVQVKVAVAGSFNDPAKGKSLSKGLIGQNVDVIFQLAGNTGLGMFEAIKEHKTVYGIGSDLNQDAIVPGKVITSVLKRTEVAAYQAIESAFKGKFNAGSHYLGLASGGIDITDLKFSKNLIPAEALKLVEKAKKAVISNTLKIPNKIEAVNGFKPAL